MRVGIRLDDLCAIILVIVAAVSLPFIGYWTLVIVFSYLLGAISYWSFDMNEDEKEAEKAK